MYHDLVERLRRDGSSWAQPMFDEAADELERLRAALRTIADNPFMDPEANAEFARKALEQPVCGRV